MEAGFLEDLRRQKQEAYQKAMDSLARYKFIMFGYWAAIWVHLNKLDPRKEVNPFKELVDIAKSRKGGE